MVLRPFGTAFGKFLLITSGKFRPVVTVRCFVDGIQVLLFGVAGDVCDPAPDIVGLGLKQPYVAEKMGVTPSNIQRYEAGTIDNTKKLVLDGLSEALHVSVEWLKGETGSF